MPRKRLVAEIAVLILCGGMLLVAALLTPSPAGTGTHTQLGMPPCGFLVVYHKPCPSCGLTTAFSNMARGSVIAAFRAHPAGPVAFLYAVGCGLVSLYSVATGRRLVFRDEWAVKSFVIVAGGVMVVGAVRLFF